MVVHGENASEISVIHVDNNDFTVAYTPEVFKHDSPAVIRLSGFALMFSRFPFAHGQKEVKEVHGSFSVWIFTFQVASICSVHSYGKILFTIART